MDSLAPSCSQSRPVSARLGCDDVEKKRLDLISKTAIIEKSGFSF
ncbi:hypothetical protein ES703_92563 [subsurface metagenome]